MESQRDRQYSNKENSIMNETVLDDRMTQTSHGIISAVTDGVASSLSSWKDPDSGVATYPAGFSQQTCFQDTTLESDLGCSSCSLQGGSPTTFLNRYKHDMGNKQASLQSCFEDVQPKTDQESVSNPNFQREGREYRRWKFANGRSMKCLSQIESRPGDFLPNSYLFLESEKKTNPSIKNGFRDFSNFKHTVM